MEATPVLRLFVTSEIEVYNSTKKPWDDVVLGDSRWTKVERSIDKIQKAHQNKRLDHLRGIGGRNGTQEDYDAMASKYTNLGRWRK